MSSSPAWEVRPAPSLIVASGGRVLPAWPMKRFAWCGLLLGWMLLQPGTGANAAGDSHQDAADLQDILRDVYKQYPLPGLHF